MIFFGVDVVGRGLARRGGRERGCGIPMKWVVHRRSTFSALLSARGSEFALFT